MNLRKTRNLMLLTGIILVMFTSTGCVRLMAKMGVNMGAPVVSLMIDEIKNTKSGRLVEEGMAGHLLLLSGMIEVSPNNTRLLNETSMLLCAFGILKEDKDPEFAKELYTLGKEYGIRALKQDKYFRRGLEENKKISDLVANLDESYAQALCWTGLNSGLWIVLNMDDPGALMGMADTVAMIKRSIELDENYYFGAGKMFLAAYYAMIPEYLGLGGGPENSEKMFKEARAVKNGDFLLVDVLEARYLATIKENKELFKSKLEYVVGADPGKVDGARLINEMAKIKAKHYLENIDKFFN